MSLPRSSPAARAALIGLLSGVALTWFALGGRLPAHAQAAPQASSEAPATTVISCPTANGGQLFTLIDTRNQAFAVYRLDPQNTKGSVKLEAVRQYRYDLKLTEYNNLPPEVATIDAMVGSGRR